MLPPLALDYSRDLRLTNMILVIITLAGAFNHSYHPQSFQNLTITSVALPKHISEKLESIAWFETKERHRFETQEFKKLQQEVHKSRKALEIELKNKQISFNQEAQLAQMLAEKAVALVTANSDREAADIESKTASEVSMIRANSEKESSHLAAERDRLVRDSESTLNYRIAELGAASAASARTAKAAALLSQATLGAQAKSLEAEAEKKIGPMMLTRRRHELDIAKLAVLETVADNPDVLIAGQAGLISRKGNAEGISQSSEVQNLLYEKTLLDSVARLGATLPRGTAAGVELRERMIADSLAGFSANRKI